jgi:hypothetical protein
MVIWGRLHNFCKENTQLNHNIKSSDSLIYKNVKLKNISFKNIQLTLLFSIFSQILTKTSEK